MSARRLAPVLAVFALLVVTMAGGFYLTRNSVSCDPVEDARWDTYRDLRPGPDDHPNAMWARHWWVGDDKTECDYRVMARRIRQLGLTDVFFHAGPLRPDGTVSVDKYRYAQRLVQRMHDLVPGVRIQAYLGQFEGSRPGTDDLDLSVPDNVRRVVATSQIFLDLGFDGIHYDIEPLMNGSQRFLDLFDQTRALTRPRGAVLSTSVEERRPDPGDEFPPNDDGGHPDAAWLQTLADHLDQIAIMTYDTGLKTDADYERWTEFETRKVGNEIGGRTTVFIGVPTDDIDVDGHTKAENVGTGSRGLRRGVAELPPDKARNVGGAIFAEWVTTEDEYSTYEREWVRA